MSGKLPYLRKPLDLCTDWELRNLIDQRKIWINRSVNKKNKRKHKRKIDQIEQEQAERKMVRFVADDPDYRKNMVDTSPSNIGFDIYGSATGRSRSKSLLFKQLYGGNLMRDYTGIIPTNLGV